MPDPRTNRISAKHGGHRSTRHNGTPLLGNLMRPSDVDKNRPEYPLMPVDEANGYWECPTCHGGVQLISWGSAKQCLDVLDIPKPERGTKRLAKHYYGGQSKRFANAAKVSGSNKYRELECVGSYQLPINWRLLP